MEKRPNSLRSCVPTSWLAFSLLLLCTFPAPGDEPEEGERTEEPDKAVFESEIQVTARKREEILQEVPGAVTAFSGAALEARSMKDLSDVADFTPNFTFSISGGSNGSPAEAAVYLRGVGQNDTGIMADPGVGIYVDGVFIARSKGSVADLLDLERVEVLRGPQGTLFGKNTTGGALHLVTRKPEPDFGGYVTATLGNLDRHDLAFRINGALGDKVFASLAGAAANRDGYTRSVESGETFGNENRDSLRAAFRFLPAENVSVDFMLDGAREREATLDQNLVAVTGSTLLDFMNQVRADNGLTILDERFVTGDLTLSHSDGPSRNDGDVFLASVRLGYTAPNFHLLSITAWRDYEYEGASDFDGSPIRFFERSFVQTQHQLSQELQFSGLAAGGRLAWVAGALYFEENPVDDSVIFAFDDVFELLEAAPRSIYPFPAGEPSVCEGPPPEGVACLGGAGNPRNFIFFNGEGQVNRLDIETVSYAAFGEVTWELNERLSLSAGLRYTFEEKDTRFRAFIAPFENLASPLRKKRDWEAVSPRVNLAYRLSDDALWYLSASHGFKSGGFNAARAVSQDELIAFEQEDLLAFETGFKTELAKHRLRLNASFFYYDYDDVQFTAFAVVGENPVLTIQNAADARIHGAELELEARPARGLVLMGNLGWIDAEYTELLRPSGASIDGDFPKTPDWQANLSVQYAFDLGRKGSWLVRGDYSWRDDFFHEVTNSEFLRQEAYGLVNARLVYELPGDLWQVALFGTNLGDEVYLENGLLAEGAGEVTAIAGRPREWGLSAKLRF